MEATSLNLGVTFYHDRPQDIDSLNPSENAPLHNYVAMQPDPGSHSCKEIIWEVAAWISLVAFVVFVAAACVFAGLFIPDYFPFVALALYSFVNPVYNFFAELRNWAADERVAKEVETKIAEYFDAIPDTEQGVREKLVEIGINPSDIQDLSDLTLLRTIIARYEHWSDLGRAVYQAITTSDVHTPDTPETPFAERRDARRYATLELGDEMMMYKVISSYMYGLILHPHSQIKDLKDIMHFIPLNERIFKRATAQIFNDRPFNTFAVFTNSQKAPFTTDEIISAASALEIATRLFAPEPAAATRIT